MADVFISYASNDQSLARSLADQLSNTFSVWWDRELVSGQRYHSVIAAELEQAKAAVVIWTPNSVRSSWVRAEADRANADNKLIPVRVPELEERRIPLPFNVLHTRLLEDRNSIITAIQNLKVMTRLDALRSQVVYAAEPVSQAEAKSAQQHESWLAVRSRDDPHALRQFLQRFKDGVYATAAQQMLSALDERAWNNAKNLNTDSAYRCYLGAFGADGRYVHDANEALRAFAGRALKVSPQEDAQLWQKACRAESVEAYENYLKAVWPDGSHIEEAQKKIDLLVARHPVPGLRTGESVAGKVINVRRSDEAAWAEARRANTASAYLEYLTAAWPSGRHIQAAQHAIHELEQPP